MNYDFSLNDDILSEIGVRVKENRINANLTQKDLAERSGLSKKSVSELERGIYNISLVNLIEIMRVLGLANNLKLLFPEIPIIDPIQLNELEKKKKKRVR